MADFFNMKLEGEDRTNAEYVAAQYKTNIAAAVRMLLQAEATRLREEEARKRTRAPAAKKGARKAAEAPGQDGG